MKKKIKICIMENLTVLEEGGMVVIEVDEDSVIDAIVEHAKNALEFNENGWADEYKSRLWETINRRWNFMLIEYAESIAKGHFKKRQEKDNEQEN